MTKCHDTMRTGHNGNVLESGDKSEDTISLAREGKMRFVGLERHWDLPVEPMVAGNGRGEKKARE